MSGRRESWVVVCGDCGPLREYTEPTQWKTIEERAKHAVGGWKRRHEHPNIKAVEESEL